MIIWAIWDAGSGLAGNVGLDGSGSILSLPPIIRALCVLYARACFDSTLQRAALWAYTSQLIGHCLWVLSSAIHFAYIVHFEEILVPRSSISSYESECRTLCSMAEETRGECSRVENIIPASSRHAPSPLHMSATTATNPLNYDTKWCIMFQP